MRKTPEIHDFLTSPVQAVLREAWNELVSEFSAETGVKIRGADLFFLEADGTGHAQPAHETWMAENAKFWAPEDREAWGRLTASRRRLEFALGRTLKALCRERYPAGRVSLSHSSKDGGRTVGCIATVLERTSEGGTRGLGVDLEAWDRPVSEGVFKKLIPDLEARRQAEQASDGRGRIVAWCEREALWKANPEPDQGLLLDYQRGAGGAYQFRAREDLGFWTRSLSAGGWVTAFALGSTPVAR